MSALSSAIGAERRSRVSGYKIKKGFFDTDTPNLAQIIAVLGEANTANQGSFSTKKVELTSAQQAAELFGYGSPIHQQMRILRPVSGDGVGGIPTIVFPQESDENATATTQVWSVANNANANATHSIFINGRDTLDFNSYEYSVSKDDTPAEVAAKIADKVNGVLSCPVIAVAAPDGSINFTTKWSGETSASLNIRFDNKGSDAGLLYSLTSTDLGAGAVDLEPSLSQFGNDWITTVLNPYNKDSVYAQLEQFNGVPDDETPTGRYDGRIFKPFLAFSGFTQDDEQVLQAISDNASRINQVTNVFCPAPKSEGFPWEASANMVAVFSRIAQNTPELDVNGKSYPDMPVPFDSEIGDMSTYNTRDFLIKKGFSTVLLENGAYQIQDLVTTYHPAQETPLQYAYARNLVIDWNVRDGYAILEKRNVKDHVLVLDGQVTDAAKSVKPKQWKAVLTDYFNDLAIEAKIKDKDFSIASLRVEIDSDNPDRFNTFFRYKRTGVARIQSTDVEAGF